MSVLRPHPDALNQNLCLETCIKASSHQEAHCSWLVAARIYSRRVNILQAGGGRGRK